MTLWRMASRLSGSFLSFFDYSVTTDHHIMFFILNILIYKVNRCIIATKISDRWGSYPIEIHARRNSMSKQFSRVFLSLSTSLGGSTIRWVSPAYIPPIFQAHSSYQHERSPPRGGTFNGRIRRSEWPNSFRKK